MFKRIILITACLATLGVGTLATPDSADAQRWRRPYYRSYYAPPRSYYYSRPSRLFYRSPYPYYATPYYGGYYGSPGYYYGGPGYYGGNGASFWFGF